MAPRQRLDGESKVKILSDTENNGKQFIVEILGNFH